MLRQYSYFCTGKAGEVITWMRGVSHEHRDVLPHLACRFCVSIGTSVQGKQVNWRHGTSASVLVLLYQ